MKKLRSLEHLLKLERWQGPSHLNKTVWKWSVKGSEPVFQWHEEDSPPIHEASSVLTWGELQAYDLSLTIATFNVANAIF